MFIAGARRAHVLVDDLLALASKLLLEHRLQRGKVQTQNTRRSRPSATVFWITLLRDLIGQLAHRQRAQIDARRHFARHDVVAVDRAPSPRPHVAQVAVHRVLVETEQQIDLVAVAVDRMAPPRAR